MQAQKAVQPLPLSKIIPSKYQVRTYFDPEYIKELGQSMKESGLQNPIKVKITGDRFELIHGECRVKAAQLIGWATIPAIVEQATEEQHLAEGLAENIQRSDIDALSEARGLNLMHAKQGKTIPEIAKKIGKSETYVNARLRLLTLPPMVQDLVLRDMLSPSAAGHVLKCKDSQDVELVAGQAIKFKMTSEGVGLLVDRLNYLYENPPESAEVKEKVIAEPELLFPCSCCERDFAKQQLTAFDLCGECSNELHTMVLDIRQRRARAAAAAGPPRQQPAGPT